MGELKFARGAMAEPDYKIADLDRPTAPRSHADNSGGHLLCETEKICGQGLAELMDDISVSA